MGSFKWGPYKHILYVYIYICFIYYLSRTPKADTMVLIRCSGSVYMAHFFCRGFYRTWQDACIKLCILKLHVLSTWDLSCLS